MIWLHRTATVEQLQSAIQNWGLSLFIHYDKKCILNVKHHLKGLPLKKSSPFFIADLPKTLSFYSRICMYFFVCFWIISPKCIVVNEITKFWAKTAIKGS